MTIPNCPVCKGIMQQTANPSLFRCASRSVWHPEPGSQLEFTHAFVMLPEDEGNIFPWMQIEIPPYTIRVVRDKSSAKSTILKTIRKQKSRWDKSKNKEFTTQELLTIDAAIDLPWHDRQTVLGRIHSYLVFS